MPPLLLAGKRSSELVSFPFTRTMATEGNDTCSEDLLPAKSRS
jgi:hypothetical protein